MKRLCLFTLSAFMVLSLGGCQERPRRVVLGIALTESYHPAVELAVKEINSRGGIRGVPIELMGMEWRVSPQATLPDFTQVLSWTKRFADHKDLVAMIGPSDSSSTLSVAAFCNQRKLPQIVTIATNPAITRIGDWTYRLCISDAIQGPALAEYAVKEWGKKRIVVYHVNNDYGRTLSQLFENQVHALGGETVLSLMHHNFLDDEDKKLILSTLRDLKKQRPPDLFVLFQQVEAAHWTVHAIRQTGLTTDLLGGDSLSPPRFIQKDPSEVEGMRMTQFSMPVPSDPLSIKFAQDFRAYTGQEADYGQTAAFDAVNLIKEAVLHNGFTREAVKAYLDQLIRDKSVVEGVGGKYVIGPDHDSRRPFYIVEARGGKQQLVKTIPVP